MDRPVKLVHYSGVNRGFKFKAGLNVDTNRWSPLECSIGGIYYTTLANLGHWVFGTGTELTTVWDVDVPEGAQVAHFSIKSKADRVILSNPRHISAVLADPQVAHAAVRHDSKVLRFVKEPSLEVQFAAVRQNEWVIQYITDPSQEVQLAAVRQNGWAIQYITDPSQEVQLAAVRQNGWVIQNIIDPSPEIQLAAVQENGIAIRYVKAPSLELQLAAVRQNRWAFGNIVDPSPEVQLAAVQNGYDIEYIKNPSPEVRRAAMLYQFCTIINIDYKTR